MSQSQLKLEPSSPPEQRTWAPGPLGLARPFWFLLGGMFVNRLGGGVFMFLAVYLTNERRFPPALAGLVVGFYAAGGTLAGPVGGALADRVGRRATLLGGTALAAICMMALGLARGPLAIFALAPLLGFFTDVCRPPLQAAVADVVPAEDRRRAFGLLYWAINLGFAGAATFAGSIAEKSFTLLFAVDAATTLIYGAIVLAAVPETRPARAAAPTAHATAADFLAPFRDRALMTLLAIQFLAVLVFQQFMVALPLDMRAHGITTREMGLLFALNGVVIVVVQPPALRLARRLSHVTLLAAGSVLVGVGFGAPALAGGAGVYATGIAVLTLGEILFASAAPALITELAPAHRRGAYMGTYQLTWGIAGATAPALGSLVLAHAGSRALWLGCLAVGLAAAVLHSTVTARAVAQRMGKSPVTPSS